MQTTHKIKMTIINKVLPISLCPLLLTSCSVSEQPQSPEALLETTPPQSVFEETEITSEEIIETAEITEAEYVSHANQKVTFEGDTSSDEITQADFKNCQEALEADGEFVLTDDHITAFDIDYDGQNELLVIYDYFFFVFEKSNGEITETHRTPITSKEHYINLNLKTYSDPDSGEKYQYSAFHFDNGGVTSDTVAAIKYDGDSDSYSLGYIISWGKVEYEAPVDRFNHAFFRKGWDYTANAAGPYDSDISGEEFLEIYNKYEGLPPWDTYISEYDLIGNISVDGAA